MIDAVAPEDMALTFAAAALIVLFGAGYAGLLAGFRVSGRRGLAVAAGICYAVLAGAVVLLSRTAHLDGYWRALSILMLAGYLFAPWGIWRLSVGSRHHPP